MAEKYDQYKEDLANESKLKKETGTNMTFVGKSREHRAVAQCKDLRVIKDKLLGRSFIFDMPSAFERKKKTLSVKEVYEHHLLCVYMNGDIPMNISISTADLVTKGIISFRTGYPEVIK